MCIKTQYKLYMINTQMLNKNGKRTHFEKTRKYLKNNLKFEIITYSSYSQNIENSFKH